MLDSSSAVIILTILLVNAKVLTFRQAMGIVLGANIGTTVSSQILAFDISKYSPFGQSPFLRNYSITSFLKEIFRKGLIINPNRVKKKNFFN